MKKALVGIVGLFACGIIVFFGAIFLLMSVLPAYQHFQLWQYQQLVNQSLPPDTRVLDFDFELIPPGAGNYCLVNIEFVLQSNLDEPALSAHFATIGLGLHEIRVTKNPNSQNIYNLRASIANGAYCP